MKHCGVFSFFFRQFLRFSMAIRTIRISKGSVMPTFEYAKQYFYVDSIVNQLKHVVTSLSKHAVSRSLTIFTFQTKMLKHFTFATLHWFDKRRKASKRLRYTEECVWNGKSENDGVWLTSTYIRNCIHTILTINVFFFLCTFII